MPIRRWKASTRKTGSKIATYIHIAQDESVDGTQTPLTFGQTYFDPSLFEDGLRMRFGASWWSSDGALTAEVQLWDQTNGYQITTGTFQTSSTGVNHLEMSSDLVIGTGNNDIKTTATRYGIRVSTTGTTNAQFAILGDAYFVLYLP